MSESENMIKCEVILVVFEVGKLSKELQFGHYKRKLVTSVEWKIKLLKVLIVSTVMFWPIVLS